MGYGSLLNHFRENELGYNARMFAIGFFAKFQLAVIMAYMLCLIFYKNEDKELFLVYTVLLIAFNGVVPLLIRLMYGAFCITLT